tara:strand:+ start:909 stop:1745 length:837 start_codon:yes stop_codon:yes gene_type:complete
MKNKVLIIGKRSFVANNLIIYLKKKIDVKLISYKSFLKIKNFNKYTYVINCSTKIEYLKHKYSIKSDLDILIAKKILNFKKCKFIFLSSRKIYKPNANIKENSRILLRDNYSKNKFITEKKINKILPGRVLILRISNLIGINKKNSNKLHKIFLDYFLENIKNNIIFENEKIYKDFLPIKIFSQIVYLLIKNGEKGTYNVSLGKKVYLNKIIHWLNYHNRNKVKIMKLNKKQTKKLNRDSFFLNNTKLKKAINIKVGLNDLKKECLAISKNLFYEKTN